MEGGPQPLLKIELRLEDPFHEEDDLSLRVEAVPPAVVPEPLEDLRLDADVELYLRRRTRGPIRHASDKSFALFHAFYRI